MDLSLFLPPLVACLVIVSIHSYLGLHVIAREVIFVDLSLAQMAALGSTVAILVGKVRCRNVWAIVRLVGNSVAIRVLIDRAGIAIPIAVRIGLIRILNTRAVVERIRDVVAVRIEVEESWLV